jgi:hypothetical protein
MGLLRRSVRQLLLFVSPERHRKTGRNLQPGQGRNRRLELYHHDFRLLRLRRHLQRHRGLPQLGAGDAVLEESLCRGLARHLERIALNPKNASAIGAPPAYCCARGEDCS